ncbi:hypothetical protein [Streptomyces sp. NBC_01803]|uniref:hypothetical protein n=1 Tax=Streptomyces sp. NBC_01803 TaxID=2975946 RepID=UPI002DDAD1A1|nr:hypothetical protein [Streptomyces sp. NBC_01803]WSA44208.1 hypothetical protein OIE51_08300 [Streptomyces sp. NBC_01803]
MFTVLLTHLLASMRSRADELRQRLAEDGGYTTETMVITAILAILGITAAGIVTSKVLARARGMDLEAEYSGE